MLGPRQLRCRRLFCGRGRDQVASFHNVQAQGHDADGQQADPCLRRRALVENGLKDIIMVVGYKKERIMSFFGDGSRFGARITYVVQEKQLGTAHALLHVKSMVKEDFVLVAGTTSSIGRPSPDRRPRQEPVGPGDGERDSIQVRRHHGRERPGRQHHREAGSQDRQHHQHRSIPLQQGHLPVSRKRSRRADTGSPRSFSPRSTISAWKRSGPMDAGSTRCIPGT